MPNPVICGACGAKVREDRPVCLRCGEPLVPASPKKPDGPPPDRKPLLIATAAGIALFGAAAMMAGRAGASSETAAAAPLSIVQHSAAPEARPRTSAGAAVPNVPEPGVAAIDASRFAIADYNGGDVAGAVEGFMEAVRQNPESAAALNNLGQVLVRAGRAAEAIPHFDRAIAIAGDTWSYHFNRARAYAELEYWPQAVSGYRDAARLFPEDYATQYNLGRALQASGDLPAALEAFERAIALAPGQADFHLSYGLALEAAGRRADAAAAYRRFLDLEPASPDAEKINARISQLEAS